jgi:NAD(P)H-flavin reductase
LVQAELKSIQEIAPSLFKLALKPEAPFAFKAGQFVIIPLPPDPAAAEGSKAPKGFYSIASAEQDQGLLELLIEHREGYVSGWMTALKAGSRLSLDGPMGKFGLKEGQAKALAFLGYKAGLAPLRSMILSLARSKAGRELHLFLGAPSPAELLMDAEWKELASKEPLFHYHPQTGDPAEGLLKALPGRKDIEIYIAGFNREADPMLARLLEAGFEKDSVKIERFG